MKVSILSTTDHQGGAAIAASRLYSGYYKYCDTNIHYIVKFNTSNNNDFIKTKSKIDSKESIDQCINDDYLPSIRSSLSNTLFSFTNSDSDVQLLRQYDIINLHWVERFISLKNLFEIVKMNIPIVWTLHDMRAFTGGCHFSAGCEYFITHCSKCPQLDSDPESLVSQNLELKKHIFKSSNLTIVTPSQWLAKQARKSALFNNKRIEVIPNGINLSQFKVLNKREAKSSLGIKTNGISLLFGVSDLKEKRKGFKELISSIKLIKEVLKKEKVSIIFFGKKEQYDFEIDYFNLGYLSGSEQLNQAYCAADIFILPSLEDNLPNTMLESLACETPVIAFDTGGISDVVSNKTGCLVPKGDVKELAKAILTLVKNSKRRKQCGLNGRKLIEKKYQSKHQATAYYQLFTSIHQTPKNNSDNKFIKNNDSHDGKTIDMDVLFEKLTDSIAQIHTPILKQKSLHFSKQYSQLYQKISMLAQKKEQYIIYGNGSLGKTLLSVMDQSIVTTIDKSSTLIDKKISKIQVYSPKNLINIKYNKIIITVLGREKEIFDYLTTEIGIDINKIILLNECL